MFTGAMIADELEKWRARVSALCAVLDGIGLVAVEAAVAKARKRVC